jgi:phage terminase small subunit
MAADENERPLNTKQLQFCKEYVLDWNGTQAAIRAGYSAKSAALIATENIRKPNIKAEIERQRNNTEELAGISKLMVVKELTKFAFHSFDEIHDTWIERKEFEALSKDVKACIQEIDTKVFKKDIGRDGEGTPVVVDVEHIRIKFVDKRASMETLIKLMGWNTPQKIDVTTRQADLTPEERAETIAKIKAKAKD